MFNFTGNKKFISTTLNIFFPRQLKIRHNVFEFEEAWKEKYNTPPLMAPIGDEMEPAIPRFTFTSKQGHSQINVSQITLALNVRYDENFCQDFEKCQNYVLERLELSLPIIEKITGNKFCYAGLINKIHYISEEKTDEQILKSLSEKFLSRDNYDDHIHDLSLKYTVQKKNKNYINLTISNVRNFSIDGAEYIKPISLADSVAKDFGIQVILDVNDRRAYNEQKSYTSSREEINNLFTLTTDIVNNKLEAIISSGKILL